MMKKRYDVEQKDIIRWWHEYKCRHPETTCSLYGYSVVVFCKVCNRTLVFTWNPNTKWFDVRVERSEQKWHGVKPEKLTIFLQAAIVHFFVPDPPGDPTGGHQEGDAARFYETINVLKHNGLDVMLNATKVDSTGTTTTCSCCRHDMKH